MFIVWNSVTSLNIVMCNMTVVFKLSLKKNHQCMVLF